MVQGPVDRGSPLGTRSAMTYDLSMSQGDESLSNTTGGSPAIRVTERAARWILDRHAKLGQPNAALRVGVKGGGVRRLHVRHRRNAGTPERSRRGAGILRAACLHRPPESSTYRGQFHRFAQIVDANWVALPEPARSIDLRMRGHVQRQGRVIVLLSLNPSPLERDFEPPISPQSC